MERDRILEILLQPEPVLKAADLMHLRLFGSVVRGDNTSSSDVDLLYELDPTRTFTLFDLGRLQYQLEDVFGTQVDLASAETLKPVIRDHVRLEAISA